MSRKFLFIDRDGTLIAEPPSDRQVDSFEKLQLEPNVIPALRECRRRGYTLVMITNQDGLGTNNFPRTSFEGPHSMMMQIFESQGISFEEVLVCPHFESDSCSCRKPNTGLVEKYIRDRMFDLESSAVIGDRESDMQLAANMGIAGIRYDRLLNGWNDIVMNLGRPRIASVTRSTKEVDLTVSVNLDRHDHNSFATGIGFFDHMLDQIATHAGISIIVDVSGDLEVDDHHTVEDTGLALGEALRNALGDKFGIARFGFAVPMDDCAAKCLLDLSGRPFLKFEATFDRDKLGQMSTEMVEHFFRSLSNSLGATIHLQAEGENTHHKVESIFKCFGRTLRQAIQIVDDSVPSSKGVL